eukprot:12934258-Prorocentrum_lima.AAC.1
MEVFDQVMPEEISALKRSGIYPKGLPAILILVKKPDRQARHGWTPKARVVCCGNFEEGTIGGRLEN